MASAHRDLRVYRLTAALGDELHGLVRQWPVADRIGGGDQLVRAVDSIGANIAEAAGRWHVGEKRQFLRTARGSLYEAEHWLERAEARGLVEAGTARRLDEIGRLLNGLIRRPMPNCER